MTPKLSFIVPVYKPVLPVLEKAIKALIDQSLESWEAIFVLDGPCDEATQAIRRLFKKSKNHYKVVEIEHGGACKARNEGAKHAQGQYWVFWDYDCVIQPNTANNWVEILDKTPEIGFVYSGYEFLDEKGAIPSEPFDPWLLKVNNYISSCFPLRRELFPGWDESLESLQDWDFWLSVVAKGAKGKFLQGYGFATAVPTPDSISGKGCTPEKWLERLDKVKAKHGISIREVCVASVDFKADGIHLAKLIDADYRDRPNDKPNHYKTIIQIGFSLNPGRVSQFTTNWGKDHKKIIYWTADDVAEIYNGCSLKALVDYSSRLNQACYKQFVEDKKSQEIMAKAGFNVEVSPLPLATQEAPPPLPNEPAFLVATQEAYGHVIDVIQRSLPDVKLEVVGGVKKIEDYTGILHFYIDRTMSQSVKRMLISGRYVISNIQAPFTGFVNDETSNEKFIRDVVEKIRKVIKKGKNDTAKGYYEKLWGTEKILEACK